MTSISHIKYLRSCLKLQGGLFIKESNYIEPGKSVPEPISSPIGYLGPSIVNKLVHSFSPMT